MKKIIGILIIIIGTLTSFLFILFDMSMIQDGIQYGFMEWDVIGKGFLVLLFGLFICICGVQLIQSPKPISKEEIYKTYHGETYIKLGGSYVVEHPRRIQNLYTALLVAWTALFTFFHLLIGSIDWPFIVSYFSMFLVLAGFRYYFARPKLLVCDNRIIFYPLFGKQRECFMEEITYYLVTSRDPKLIQDKVNSKNLRITYYHELEELFYVDTDLENVNRLLVNIQYHMKGKGNESKES